MSVQIYQKGQSLEATQAMKRSKSDTNIEVTSIIDKDQSTWNFQSASTIPKSYNSNDIINWLKASRSDTNQFQQTNMEQANNQTNLLKLQLQQISNQIIQLQLHLTTLTQLDSDSDEVINNITSIQENIDDFVIKVIITFCVVAHLWLAVGYRYNNKLVIALYL